MKGEVKMTIKDIGDTEEAVEIKGIVNIVSIPRKLFRKICNDFEDKSQEFKKESGMNLYEEMENETIIRYCLTGFNVVKLSQGIFAAVGYRVFEKDYGKKGYVSDFIVWRADPPRKVLGRSHLHIECGLFEERSEDTEWKCVNRPKITVTVNNNFNDGLVVSDKMDIKLIIPILTILGELV